MSQDRTYLRPDGSVNMDDNYNPVEPMDLMTKKHVEQPIENIGVVNSDYAAVAEYGSKFVHKTVLTLDGAFGAIAGGAALAVGRQIYAFPAGVIRILTASMNGVSLLQSEGNVTADTPDLGIGTTIASGEVAVLSGTAAFENVLTGQTMADCAGTEKLATVASTLAILAADSHNLYLNVADTWAASGDAALGFSGEVVVTWEYLS